MDNNLISEYQYGFLPGKSTQQAVFQFVKHLHGSMNNNKLVGTVFLDIAKAFNCVDHVILCDKMRMSGFSNTVIKWFRSYLTRYQITKINNVTGTIQNVPDGLAQGTVLGPLLFIFYINDVVTCLNHVNISMFADDCVLYTSGNNWNIVRLKLQQALDSFVNWTVLNALSLNILKTKAVIFGNRHKLSRLKNPDCLIINNENLAFVKKYNYLGIPLDAEMNLEWLYKCVDRKINNKIYNLRKVRRYMSFKTSVDVYKHTILPILDYGGFLLLSLSKERKNDLQIAQNDILRICNNSRLVDRVSIPKLHKKAHLLSLKQRWEKQLLSLMYIYSTKENVRLVRDRVTRNIDKFVFKTETRIGTKYENSPFYRGTILWNSLSKELQFADDIHIFKTEIAKMYKVFKN